jgi:hypothetical protein
MEMDGLRVMAAVYLGRIVTIWCGLIVDAGKEVSSGLW